LLVFTFTHRHGEAARGRGGVGGRLHAGAQGEEAVAVSGNSSIPSSFSTHSLYLPYCREYFQKEQLNDHIDPDVTVAYGAASVLD
jgi:hypothetical protein